ncbi:hypothetical protein ACXVUH_10160 [Ligilactobacillus salivarius]
MAVSKARIKASRKYDAKNPQKTTYMTLRRHARNFIAAAEGTKAAEAIKWRDTSDYKADLLELKQLIEDKLSEL